MTELFDVDAYCERIGYRGPRATNGDVLGKIVERHALSIPFENLDILLGRPIRLDSASIEAKLVRGRRGGYCFEHNTLLAGILRQLGFDVATHLGRGRWRVPPGITLPRTHMVLTVTVDGHRRLVDGGFGGVGLTSALRLDTSEPQPSLFESQRVVAGGEGHLVQAQIAGEWRDLYSFADDAVPAIDFEVANWYTSTHPASRFRRELIVCGATPEARHVLFDTELTRYGRGTKESMRVEGSEALLGVLATRFGLVFPADTRFATVPAGN